MDDFKVLESEGRPVRDHNFTALSMANRHNPKVDSPLSE
jgi:hypothetical protein